jgi:hypothetical protein
MIKLALKAPTSGRHRLHHATIEGGYELTEDEPCLVLAQLAAAESTHHDFGA